MRKLRKIGQMWMIKCGKSAKGEYGRELLLCVVVELPLTVVKPL